MTANHSVSNIFGLHLKTRSNYYLAKRVNLSKYLEMLMVCTCGKFEENLNQTFPFTTHLHIISHGTNIQVLPHFTSQCKENPNLQPQIYHAFAQLANMSKSVFSSSASGLDSESKFQMFTLFSGRNVHVNLCKIFWRISEVWENAQY